MVYIICYDWPSTSGNHTGMRYLYEYIQKRNPELYLQKILCREQRTGRHDLHRHDWAYQGGGYLRPRQRQALCQLCEQMY